MRDNAIERALQIDGTLAQAHNALAELKYQYVYDWTGAEHEFKILIKPIPGAENDPEALRFAGGLVPEELETTGESPRTALIALNEWVERERVSSAANRPPRESSRSVHCR